MVIRYLLLILFLCGCSSNSIFEAGESLIADGKYEDAVAYYSNLINQKKCLKEGFYKRAEASYKLAKQTNFVQDRDLYNQRLDSALQDLTQLYSIEGESSRLLSLKGRIIYSKDFEQFKEQAISFCESSITLDLKNEEAYLCLIDIYDISFSSDDYFKKRMHWINEGLKHLPNSSLLNLQKTLALNEKGLYDDLFKFIDKLISSGDREKIEIASFSLLSIASTAHIKSEFGVMLKSSDRNIDLITQSKFLSKLKPPFYDKAVALFGLGLYQDALKFLNEHIKDVYGKELANYYELRSKVLLSINPNDVEKSLADINKSIAQEPSHYRYFIKSIYEGQMKNHFACSASMKIALNLLREEESFSPLTEKKYEQRYDACDWLSKH